MSSSPIFFLGGDFIKIRKVLVCFLVVLLCFNGFVFSVSASSDDIQPGRKPIFTTQIGVGIYNFDDVSNHYAGYTESDFVNCVESYYGINLDDYYYYFLVGCYPPRFDQFPSDIAIFPKDGGLVDNTFFLTDTGFNALTIDKTNVNVFRSCQMSFKIKDNTLNFGYANDGFTFRLFYAYNNSLALITNIPTISVDGSPVLNDYYVNYDMSVSDDYIATLSATTNSESDLKYHVSIYNQSATEPSEATHIPYAPVDSFVQHINANTAGLFQFDFQDFRDKCSDMKTFSDKIIISCWCMGDNDFYNEKFFYLDLNDPFTDDNPKKALFAEKKDYKSFPELEDYLYSEDFPDIRDYVDFTMFDEADSIGDYIVAIFQFLWSCVTGFFKWLWVVLKYIFFNFVGLFRWLGACMWTIIENIGIALYNLVVDLRRLVLYLFVPEKDELDYLIKEKAPSLTRILSHIEAGKSASSSDLSINLFGKKFSLNFAEVIPSDIRLTIRNATTVVFLALQVLIPIRKIYRVFGIVNGSDDTSLGGETH